MNKKNYVEMRNSKKYDLTWFYDYFLENGGANIGISDFGQIFNSGNLENILKTIDKKLGLTVLFSAPNVSKDLFGRDTDSGSQFIKCWE